MKKLLLYTLLLTTTVVVAASCDEDTDRRARREERRAARIERRNARRSGERATATAAAAESEVENETANIVGMLSAENAVAPVIADAESMSTEKISPLSASDGIIVIPSTEKIDIGGKVRIEKVEDVSLNGLTSCDLVVRVSNTTASELSVESGDMTLSYGSSRVGTVVLDSGVSIAAKSIASVRVPLSLKLDNLLTGLSVSNKIQKGDYDNIFISVDAVIRVGNMRQNVIYKDMPLADVLSAAGVGVKKK